MKKIAQALKYSSFVGGMACFTMLLSTRFVQCPPEKTGYMPGEVIENLPSARNINSIDQALRELPRFRPTAANQGKMEEAIAVERLVRAKFYHGYSKYTFCENWIANFAGHFVWSDLSAKIDPDDVLDHPYAGCSQQGMVVQELLKRRGFEYATVGLPREPFPHFASAVKISGKWFYIDSWGPIPRGQERLIPLNLIRSGESLDRDFVGPVGNKFRLALAQRLAFVRNVNSFPASRGLIFQKATLWFSNWGWLVFMAFAAIMHVLPKTASRASGAQRKMR